MIMTRRCHKVLQDIIIWIAVCMVDVNAFGDWPIRQLPDIAVQTQAPFINKS
jgi:hypothetical protein